MLLLGTTLFGAASVLAGLAPSFALLVTARLLQGAGEAVALPASMAVIVLMFPEGPRRSRALSVWAAVASCGLVVGFVASGIITELLGWRWIFLVSVPFILVVLATVVLLVPGGRAAERAPLDLPGALLLVAAPLLFTLGVVEAGGADGTLPWLPPVALARRGGGRGAVRQGRAPRTATARAAAVLPQPAALPRQPRHRSAERGAVHLVPAVHLLPAGSAGRSARSRPSLTMLPLAVSLIAASLLIPRLFGRWGARVCVLAGIGCTMLAMAAIALVSRLGAAGPAMIPAMMLVAAGIGFGIVGLQYVAVTGVTEDDAGIASGVQRAADQLGGATGVTVYVGIGFAPALDGIDPFLTSSLLALAGLAAAGFVAWRISLR
ncbi:MFS transporter [Nonomuraea ferruginea]